MIDWHARLHFTHGRHRSESGHWELMFGLTYDPRRRSTFDQEIIPGCLTFRFLIWWVEVTYEPSLDAMDRAIYQKAKKEQSR